MSFICALHPLVFVSNPFYFPVVFGGLRARLISTKHVDLLVLWRWISCFNSHAYRFTNGNLSPFLVGHLDSHVAHPVQLFFAEYQTHSFAFFDRFWSRHACPLSPFVVTDYLIISLLKCSRVFLKEQAKTEEKVSKQH